MDAPIPGLDVEQLTAEIQKTYTSVSCEPERDYVFPTGRAWLVDLGYPADLLARVPAAELRVLDTRFVEGRVEQLPFADASFDVVISNGLIDLVLDKDAAFSELHRVLRPGGRLRIADVTIQRPVSVEGRRNIDLWTG